MMNLIIGDIIHLIGYYPSLRPTTTTTPRPSHDVSNMPYYPYPYNQNEFNYESNHIQQGPSVSSYPTYHSPLSSSHNVQNTYKPQNNYNYNSYGGYVDDGGYSVTPSPVITNNRPQSTPSRPQSTNVYQQQDYPDDNYNYGSYQGDLSKTFKEKHLMNAWSTNSTPPRIQNSHLQCFLFLSFSLTFYLWLTQVKSHDLIWLIGFFLWYSSLRWALHKIEQNRWWSLVCVRDPSMAGSAHQDRVSNEEAELWRGFVIQKV